MNKLAKKNITLENVRAQWVFLTELNGDGKYSMQIILPKDHPQVEIFKKTLKQVLTEGFPGENLKTIKTPLRDHDKEVENEGRKEESALEGCYFLNASANAKYPPQIVVSDSGKKRIANEAELKAGCYSGAYFHVSLSLYPFVTEKNQKRVCAGINAVMLYKKGDPLGSGGVSVDAAFGDVEETQVLSADVLDDSSWGEDDWG